MRMFFVVAAMLAMAFATPALAQQRPDPDADVTVMFPNFPMGQGPLVRMDSAHRELHTVFPTSGYAPLAAMLKNDGYRVKDYNLTITAENLAGISVLVIANARSTQPSPTGSPLDSLSAFTPAEIDVLHNWVMEGGSLLIVADHAPYAGGARDLAAAFGFTINRYAAYPPGWPNSLELFTSTNGGLVDGDLTTRLHQIQTFFGTGFTAPSWATPLLRFPSGWTFEDKSNSGMTPIPTTVGDLRGASLIVGEGRIVLLTEAAQLSAQISAQETQMGWNSAAAPGNKQFARNIFYWLSTGAVPPQQVEDGGPLNP